MNIPRKAIPIYLVTITYMMFIFYLSSGDRLHGSGSPGGVSLEKLDHIVEFGILGALLFLSFHLTPLDYSFLKGLSGLKLQNEFRCSLVIGGLYGLSDEIHQAFVPGRKANPFDLIADIFGVVVGIVIMIWLLDYYSTMKNKEKTKKNSTKAKIEEDQGEKECP